MYYDQGAEPEKRSDAQGGEVLQKNWDNAGMDRRDVVKSHIKPVTKEL